MEIFFDKMNAIQIPVTERITEADRRYCEAHQQAYTQAKNDINRLLSLWQETDRHQKDILQTVETESYGMDSYIRIAHISATDFTDKLEELASAFIHSIIRHFNRTYLLDMDVQQIAKSLLPPPPRTDTEMDYMDYRRHKRELTLHYEDILEQLFLQLDGHSLTEYGVFTLKEKCTKASRNDRTNEPLFSVHKDTLQYTYGCTCDTWLSSTSWKLNETTKRVLQGIAHYETNALDRVPISIAPLLSCYSHDSAIYNFIDCQKVKSLKMYKNHRVDIRFRSEQEAREFSVTYLSQNG